MGGVPVKHHTKGKVGRRRSHHALKATSLLACTECRSPVLPHRVCGNCGTLQTRTTRAGAEPRAEKKEAAAAPAVQEEAAESPAEEVAEAVEEAPAEDAQETPAEEEVAEAEEETAAAPAEDDENRT